MSFLRLSLLFLIQFSLIVSSATGSTLSTGDSVTTFVNDKIQTSEVLVFSKSYCPFCKAAKGLLQSLNDNETSFSVTVVELDQMDRDDMAMIQKELADMTQQRTVPNIFLNGMHLGGNDDLQALHRSGKLDRLLNQITASRDL